jgi:hypothetical protein
MQALSLTVHIPLVCFGIAFPVMVLLMEWWGQRTGDPLCRTIARRWSRVVIALFAIGAITGTMLSFEMGVLWPNFTSSSPAAWRLQRRRRLRRPAQRSRPDPGARSGPRRAPRDRLPHRRLRIPHHCRGRVGARDRRDHAAIALGLAAAAPRPLEDNEPDGSSRSPAP